MFLFATGGQAQASHSEASGVGRAAPGQTPRQYAQTLAASKYGWVGYQWDAIDAIVGPESSWNPCASYPGRHDCAYGGSSSCGIPQANPCPAAWRGRLASTWRAQVEWLLAYLKGRYGSPAAALGFRRGHGYY